MNYDNILQLASRSCKSADERDRYEFKACCMKIFSLSGLHGLSASRAEAKEEKDCGVLNNESGAA
jgi:hypothetical protein